MRLAELRIRDLAVIEEVVFEPGDGLTVLSGETGAGKSIVVEALSLLLGERASADVVRAGELRAVIEGRFDIGVAPSLTALLAEAGLEPDDGWLILRREIRRSGRSRAWVNGSPATAGLMRRIGSRLVDLHGQHEHQTLLRPPRQRRTLDAWARAGELATEVARLHESRADVGRRIEELGRAAAKSREREDYLRFKLGEIEDAALQPGEDERLAAEARRLEHSGELIRLADRLHRDTYERDGSLVEKLGELEGALSELRRLDPEARGLDDLFETALRSLEELGRRAAEYRDGVPHDPAGLEVARERLDLLFKLKSKYGPTLDGVFATAAAAGAELETMESADSEIERLRLEEREVAERLAERAAELSAARHEAARRLETAVDRELPALGMEGGAFRVELTPREEIAPDGAESIEFLVTTNPGFEPGPLARVASGGELSRVMLALKTVFAGVGDARCLVFDEIDAGIGGEVAHRVGERLAAVGADQQVLVVTHLAQIAARADRHFVVDKRSGRRATTLVTGLDDEARVRELARMLGGDPESDASRTHAAELLATADR